MCYSIVAAVPLLVAAVPLRCVFLLLLIPLETLLVWKRSSMTLITIGTEKHGGGAFEPTTPRKRKALNHDAGGVFGRDLMQHLTEDEITDIERKTAVDGMELESDFDEDEDEVVYTNGNLAHH
jgi:hypothetical protein